MSEESAAEFVRMVREPLIQTYEMDERDFEVPGATSQDIIELKAQQFLDLSHQAILKMRQVIPDADAYLLPLMDDPNPLVRLTMAATLQTQFPSQAWRALVDLAEMEERILPDGRGDYHYRSIQGRAAMTLWFMLDGRVEDWPTAPDEFWRDPKFAARFIAP